MSTKKNAQRNYHLHCWDACLDKTVKRNGHASDSINCECPESRNKLLSISTLYPVVSHGTLNELSPWTNHSPYIGVGVREVKYTEWNYSERSHYALWERYIVDGTRILGAEGGAQRRQETGKCARM